MKQTIQIEHSSNFVNRLCELAQNSSVKGQLLFYSLLSLFNSVLPEKTPDAASG